MPVRPGADRRTARGQVSEGQGSAMPLPFRPSRRAFLTAAGAGALTTAASKTGWGPHTGLAAAAPGAAGASGEFAGLRRRWRELLLGTGFDPAAEPYAGTLRRLGEKAAKLRAEMEPAAGSLFPGVPFQPSTGVTQSYERLAEMARAYAQPATGLTGDGELLSDVLRGLAHVHGEVYNRQTEPWDNWWDWQIGGPLALLDTLTVLYDETGEAARADYLAAVDHFLPESVFDEYTGTSTGANRVDFCRAYALGGFLGDSARKLRLASAALSPVFPYVTEGDGLYADGSFIQHSWVAYSGTYGHVLLDGLGRLFALLDGTAWEVTDPARQIVMDSVLSAYAPLLHNGLMMDSVSGRAISRGILVEDTDRLTQSDHSRGHQLAAAVAVLRRSASAAERERWGAMVRGWIERDTAHDVLSDPQFGVADLARLRELAEEKGRAGSAGRERHSEREPVGHTLFPAMARAVHRRPGWCVNIAMASERVAYYECGNGENPRGWHTGAGMVSWWGGGETLSQYTDHFWPTVDWYRLPGTTVSRRKLADNAGGEWGEARPDTRWAGGASDGEFAAVGQQLRGLGSTLTARTSWFCVDDAVICLGAGVSCADGTGVETVVDNRCLGESGPGRLLVDGVHQPERLGETVEFERAGWAHLAGHGGWVWPGGGRLKALREDRTGAWSAINERSVTDRFTRRYLTLWMDHGTDPSVAHYLYLLMPGASPAQLAVRAADRRWLAVDANTSDGQGVTVRRLGVTAANFWAPGTVGALSSSAPASVLVRRRGGRATLWVAEPPRTGGEFTLTWQGGVTGVISAEDGVEAEAAEGKLTLRVSPGTAGRSLRCVVRLSPGR